MPIFRLSVRPLSRSEGRSATAAAAYRSGTRIFDERTGRVADYRRRQRGVERTALVGWTGTRGQLWNAVEAREARADALLAREWQLALPHELDAAARWSLATGYAMWLHVRYGIACDVAEHAPGRRGDSRNRHVHIMGTRRVVRDGALCENVRRLDARAGGRAEVEAQRAEWARMVNAALAAAGVEARVDHRSYARQGASREAEHVSRGALELEARGVPTAQGDDARAARRRNRRRRATAAAVTPPALRPSERARQRAAEATRRDDERRDTARRRRRAERALAEGAEPTPTTPAVPSAVARAEGAHGAPPAVRRPRSRRSP